MSAWLPLALRGLTLTGLAVCMVPLAGCGGGASAAPTPDPGPAAPVSVAFAAGPVPQLRLQRAEGAVHLTVLRDDLIHVAYGPALTAGAPYFSPMVGTRTFPGPSRADWDAGSATLSTGALRVSLSAGCWQVGTLGADARVLTRLCVQNWRDDRLTLSLSPEGATEVLGLGQRLESGRYDPSWLGRERRPAGSFGNEMGYSDIAASGDTQVPVFYALGAGTRGHGVFVDSAYPLRFDFAAADWRVESPGPSLGLFLFSGPDLRDLRRDYLDITGRPPVPPLKAFGLWISEYGYDNWAELDGKLASLRAAGLPVDGAVLDLQWFGGIQGNSEQTAMGRLTWDTAAFPAPAAKLRNYADSGLGIVTIEESYIGAGLPEHAELAAQRHLAMDCAPPCTRPVRLSANPWWGIGGMLDWSSVAAGRWWHDRKRAALIDDGVLGHWTDLGEPEMYSGTAWYAGFDWYGAVVRRHADIHNLYNLFWSRSIADETARTHPGRRPWVLSRSGTAGSQRYGVAMWSGDVASSFAALGAQMAAQSNMSLSGFDYYGSDVGGFIRGGLSGAALDRLYTRWFATSALLDVPLRPHVMNLCNCTETAPDRIGDRASNRAALDLRYRLVPYLYSLAHAAWAEGEAVFPPLALHFPADAAARRESRTKMIGPWLLFGAPASAEATVPAYLPTGRWRNFHRSGEVLESTGTRQALPVEQGGLVQAPLYLREGAIVPMLQVAPAHLGDPRGGGVRWFDDLVVRVVPAASESVFTLVEDDGLSRGYEQGVVCRTTIRARRASDGTVSLSLTPDNRTGATAQRTLAFELLGAGDAPSRVLADGAALPRIPVGASGEGWWPVTGGVRVQLAPRSVDAALSLSLQP